MSPPESLDPRTHPEYELEAERLAAFYAYLQEEIDSARKRYSAAGDRWAARSLAGIYDQRFDRLLQTEEEPYFGRFDFHSDDQELTEEYYISKSGEYGAPIRVVDCRAPVATLFYMNDRYHVSYNSRDGRKA